MTNLAPEKATEEVDIEAQCEETETDETSEQDFPNRFNDPITGNIMTEPIVNPAGDSYDKASLTFDPSITYYPNRALQSIIEHEIALSEKSVTGSLRRFDDALQRGISHLVDQNTLGGQYRSLPESYYCPITCDLIVDPVITPDGISYERQAIVNWIRVNGTSPVTRDSLSVEQLIPNNNLYDLIQGEKDRTSDSIHPEIRRWKESGVSTTRPDMTNIPIAVTAPSAPSDNHDEPTTRNNNSTNNYPTTPAGIEERRRRRQRTKLLMVCSIFVLVLILLFVPYSATIVIVLAIALFLSTFSRSNRRRQ